MRYNSFMKSKNLKVSVLMSCYNDEELLRKNLPKIMEMVLVSKDKVLEIIVVDDGSTDGSGSYIRENFPQIKLIKHKLNRGVTAAYNTGVRMAKGDLVLTISTDMIPRKNILSYLLPYFSDEKTFAVSFHEKNLGPEKAIWREGLIQFKQKKESSYSNRTFYIRKGEGIFRRKMWMELGGMDEKLFSPFFWEDLDLSYRAAKMGYKNLWEPQARVEHTHLGAAGKLSKKYIEKLGQIHMLLFIWKNIQSKNLMRKHFIGILRKIFKDPKYILVVFSAVGKIGTVIKLRKKMKKEGRISDEAIFASLG